MKTKIVQDGRKCKLVCNLPSRRLYKALPKIVQDGRNAKFFLRIACRRAVRARGLSVVLFPLQARMRRFENRFQGRSQASVLPACPGRIPPAAFRGERFRPDAEAVKRSPG
ncbi:hypothetical protein [Alistipes shahii]|uniref:hypothetical protein n=1 Tax=Alistipes shahii TaxID=328814 RepID=UPI00241CD7A0|nr:hypothetical protein [Alistipes shahii]